MARGSSRGITKFDNEAQRALQTTSLTSKLKIKDTILKECLHIHNQNFDNRKYQHCVQCSEDDWMVWKFCAAAPAVAAALMVGAVAVSSSAGTVFLDDFVPVLPLGLALAGGAPAGPPLTSSMRR